MPHGSLSPLDGRYAKDTAPLAPLMSEAGLMHYRVLVEGEYLIALSEIPGIGIAPMTQKEQMLVRGLAKLSPEDVAMISDIERKGYGGTKATEHDVKAVEYFMKEKLKNTPLKDRIEYLHFALTSEDTNNLAYALMLSDAVSGVLLPALGKIHDAFDGLAKRYANLPMLARTHGQPASPTTFGKEFRVFAERLGRQMEQLRDFRILAKLNGATGNYNAHLAAYPKVDWMEFTRTFIERLNAGRAVRLLPNLVTTQIEPHDTYAELFDIFRRINMILINVDQDIWHYISDGWIGQEAKEGEVGSSTMPHKVNPIKFENSEGNLGIANTLLGHFSAKLAISRLQRDLTDSTVERNFGVAFGHCLVGYANLLTGLGRIRVNEAKVAEALREHPEVLAEAIQTILRREGAAMPYEELKALTRGQAVTLEALRKFIRTLNVKKAVKDELLELAPEGYIGLAKTLAEGTNEKT